MTNRPKQIGTACETAVVRHCQSNGFPFAERLALHGALDEGDVQLCPGVVVEVKGGKRAETASDALIAAWLDETEVERRNRKADVAFLVTKRAGKGAANAGLWWAWMRGDTFVGLVLANEARPSTLQTDLPAVRVTLAAAVALLRRAGWGDPL